MPNSESIEKKRSQRRLSWDILRVVAVCSVVFQHVTHQAPINHPELGPYPVTLPLQFGASTLMVISAYFVCVTVRRGNTRQWLRNRLARVLPAYFVAVLATYAVTRLAVAAFNHLRFDGPISLLFGDPSAVAGPTAFPWYLPDLPDLVGNLLMVQAWSPDLHWIDASYWTLPAQVMAFVAAAMLWRRFGWGGARLPALLWTLVIVPVVVRFTLRGDDASQWIKSVFDGLALHRVALFGAGVAIWLWTAHRLSGRHLGAYLLAVLVAQDAHARFTDTPSTIAFGVILLAVVAAAGGPDWKVGPLHRLAPVITWLGGISYGLYLVNQELGFVVARVLVDAGVGPVERIVVCVGAVILLGWLMTRYVERPAHRRLTSAQPQAVRTGGSPASPVPLPRPASQATIAGAGPLISPELLAATGARISHLR
ncbi:acyltransferase [Actinophytocola sp.]|uniref:acyltransferase family protein n=1 Tax=Actinophytocola sp. TaxID=1872138 RepID=UPI002D8077FD|nr:acyltransferase [Actinophytocola sp.]HET9143950.1 acyltransferase [Actinophytocola sp.]